MRNDSRQHYQEVRFNMNKPIAMALLFEHIEKHSAYSDDMIIYGNAIRTFGRW